MAGNLEKLSVVFSTNISQYRKDMSTASSATKGWASDTEKAGDKAETAAKKSEGAFSRISRAIHSTRSEAKKGAEFEVRANDNAFSKITSRIKAVRSDVNKGADFAVRTDERGFSGTLNRIRGARKEASSGATMNVNFEQRGAAGVMASGKAVGASMDRLDGRDVTVDINADKKGLSSLSSGLGGVASGIRNVSTVAKASALPVMIAGAGAAIPTVLALGGSLGGLALNLGKASVGFGLVAAAAAGGAVGGLKLYAAGITSTISASREAYAAANEHRMEMLAQERQQILTTKASTAFNRQIDRSSLTVARLQAEIGKGSFPVFTRELKAWDGELSRLTPKLADTATKVTEVGGSFSSWLRGAENGKVLGRTVDFLRGSAVRGAEALSGAGKAGIMAFQPLIPLATKLQGQISGLTDKAAKWTASAEGQAKLGDVYKSLYNDAAKLGPVLMNAARGTAGLFSAIDQAGLADQASAGLATLAAGYARIGVKGSEARAKVVGFLSQSKALMPFVAGAAGKLAGSVGRIASGAISMRAEGSKLTVLQSVFKGVGDSAAPLERLLLGTFKALGPELATLIPNVIKLAETFAGSTGPLVLYAQTANRLMTAFNSLSPGTKTLIANLVGLKAITGAMGFGGLISGAGQMLINYRLLSGQSKVLKAQQGGVAASNVAVGTTATGASAGMTRMAVAGRVLRGVMLTMVLPVAAVVGLGAAFFYAYNKSERFRAGVDKLDTALIGNKNTAEITKNGWKGLGNVASDNSGISILWAKDLGKIETGMRRNSEAATPFNQAMLDLGQRMRDNKGISGGLSGVWRSMKTTMTDNKGLSDLWTKGTGNLTSKLRDNKGASGALRGAWAGLKQRAMDNKGASAAWAGGLEGLRKRISDNKGVSSAWAGGLSGLKKRLTDNKGASGALGGALSGLKNRLTDNKGASGALKNALGSLREKAVGAGAGFVTLRNQGLTKLGELKNKGVELAGNLKTGAVNRFEEMRSGSRGKFQQQTANGIAKFAELEKRGLENIGSFVKGGLDKYTEMRRGGATRFEALRGTISDRLGEAKKQGISRTHEMGTELKASWGRQWENAKDKFSDIRGSIGSNLSDAKDRGIARTHELGTELGASWVRQRENARDRFAEIRGAIGSNLSDAKDRGLEHMATLGGGLRDAYGRFLEFTGVFGVKFGTILSDKFGGAINKAREWLGGLMKAVANVLGAFGADSLAGDARSLGNGLQEPLKFARGGITNPKDGYGIVGEAGQREAVVNLEQRTPESVAALRAANASPNAEDRGHRGLPEPPGEKRRAERKRLEAPLTKSTTAGGGVYTGWDTVLDHEGYARYDFNTSFVSAYDRALSAWDDGRSPIDIRKGFGGARIADGYYGSGESPAWASSNGIITNNRSLMDGYTTDQNNAIATHEVGHTLGLGHGIPAPSIMNYASSYDVGGVPTSNDWMYLQKLWGPGPGGGTGGDPNTIAKPMPKSGFPAGRLEAAKQFAQSSAGMPYQWGGGGDPSYDCSGFMAAIQHVLQGQPGNSGRLFSTHSFVGSGPPGWQQGQGEFTVGVTHGDVGHMAGTLGGMNVESRGDAGVLAGPNARGATDSLFDAGTWFLGSSGSGWLSGSGGGSIFDWMGAITSGLAKVGTPDIGGGILGEGMKSYAPSLLGNAKDFLIDKAKSVFGSVKDTLGDAYNKITGGGDPAKNRAMGQEMFPQSGLSGSFSDVDAIWTQESGWDHTAQNPTSTAFGIPQFLDQTWAQYGGKSTDPKGQIDKGYSYIADRYDGSASKALDFKRANGWYGHGGVIPGPPGKEVMTRAHAGERILSEKNNAAFEHLANSVELWSSRQQGAKAVEIRQTGGDSSGDMSREELRAIRSELAAMRRTLAQEIGDEVGGKLMGKPGERNQLRHTKNVNERHKAAGLIS